MLSELQVAKNSNAIAAILFGSYITNNPWSKLLLSLFKNKKKRHNVAIVATARKVLVCIYHMLEKRVYKPR